MALVWAILPSRMGAIGDRLGRKVPMTVGLLVSGVVILVLPHTTSLLLLAVPWALEALAFVGALLIVLLVRGPHRRRTEA